jgi:hypothetical protein
MTFEWTLKLPGIGGGPSWYEEGICQVSGLARALADVAGRRNARLDSFRIRLTV